MDGRIAVLRSRFNFLGFVDATISKTPKVEEKPFFFYNSSKNKLSLQKPQTFFYSWMTQVINCKAEMESSSEVKLVPLMVK